MKLRDFLGVDRHLIAILIAGVLGYATSVILWEAYFKMFRARWVLVVVAVIAMVLWARFLTPRIVAPYHESVAEPGKRSDVFMDGLPGLSSRN